MKNDTIIFLACFAVILFFALLFLNSACEDFVFYLTHKNPVATGYTKTEINPAKDPVQINLPDFQKMQKIQIKDKTFFINPIAKYSISAMVLSTNMDLGVWGLSREDFDYIAMIDVVLGWGEAANKTLFEKNVKKLGQKKHPDGSRMYFWRLKQGSAWSVDYMRSHTSHNHMIAATPNIMSALYCLKKYEIVKMDGYLVDIYKDGNVVAMTSVSRSDTDGTSRPRDARKAGGSCEVFYVTQIQIGNNIYK